MKKIRQVFDRLSVAQKIGFFLLIFVLTTAGLLTGTRTWTSIHQSALNMGNNTVVKKEVYLQKFERDFEGNETQIAIAGAEFYLYLVEKDKETQLGDKYTTDQEGKITVTLPSGEYYFEENDPSAGYTYDRDSKGNVIKRYPFTVTPESINEQAIVVAYNQRLQGSLEVTKTVQNKDNLPLTEAQRQLTFDFLVTFSDQGRYFYRLDGGEKQALISGETLALKHGEKAVFEDIPVGLHYIITEKQVPGYSVSAENSSGNISEEGSIVSFVNTFEQIVGELDISKTIIPAKGAEVTDAQKKQAFTFEFTFSDTATRFPYTTNMGRVGSLASGETVLLHHEEHLFLKELPIGVSYEIHEKEESDYSSSPSDYSGTIRSQETVALPFVNQSQLDETATGSLQFTKQVLADSVDDQQVFSFVLTFSDQGKYLYQRNEEPIQVHTSGDKLTLKHGDTIHFPTLPAGLHYQLVEQPLKGYQPQLESIQGTILSHYNAQFTFYNYREETAQLVVKKIGTGEGFDPEKIFTFHLWLNGEKQPESIQLKAGEMSHPIEVMIGDTWQVVEEDVFDEGYSQTSLTQGTGVVTQPNQVLTVTQTNTYTAKQMVDLAGKKTWSLPENSSISLPEMITVQLKDGDTVVATQEVSGPEWVYQFHVPKQDEEGQTIDYTIEELPVEHFKPVYSPGTLDLTNVYIPPIHSRALTIEKRLLGDQPEEEEIFDFRLTPGKEGLSIKGAGQGSFAPITFTHAGTFVYTISERNKGTLGYSYDPSIYTWTIVVAEKDAQLEIVSEELRKNGELYDPEKLLFENRFEVSKAVEEKLTITGEKNWDYGDQPVAERPERITVLLRANGQVVYQKEVTAAEQWMYSFVVNVRDRNGQKIQYEIDEVDLLDYKKTIRGYDLTNTYVGSSSMMSTENEEAGVRRLPNTSGQRSPIPSTGEKSGENLAIIGLFLLLIVGLLYLKKRKMDTT